jgi:hypothetical protein
MSGPYLWFRVSGLSCSVFLSSMVSLGGCRVGEIGVNVLIWGLTRPRNLDWIKLDITILSTETIVLLSVFFTGLVFLVFQSEFCLGLWIKSCRLVNYCTIRALKWYVKLCLGLSDPS